MMSVHVVIKVEWWYDNVSRAVMKLKYPQLEISNLFLPSLFVLFCPAESSLGEL